MKLIRIIILFLSVSSLFLVSFFPQSINAQENNFAEAIYSYYNQEYDRAREILTDKALADEISEEVIELQDYEVYYYLIRTEIALNNYRAARDLLDNLAEAGYQPGELYWKLGEKYLNREGHFDSAQFDLAQDLIFKGVELGHAGDIQRRDLAHAEYGLDNYQEAIDLLREVSDDILTASDLSILARSNKKLGNESEAINYFERLIVRKPEDAGAHLDLAKIYYDSDEYEEAIDVLERGLERSPGLNSLKSLLAKSYYQNEEYSLAMDYFSKVLERHNHNYEAHFYQGLIYKEWEEYDQAGASWENATRYNPGYVNAYLELGKLALTQDNHYRAISHFSRALEENPDHGLSYYYLGKAFYKIEMFKSAEEELQKALRRNPDIEKARELLADIEEIMADMDGEELEETELQEADIEEIEEEAEN